MKTLNDFFYDLENDRAFKDKFFSYVDRDSFEDMAEKTYDEVERFLEEKVLVFLENHGYTVELDDIITYYMMFAENDNEPNSYELGMEELDNIAGGINIQKSAKLLLASQILSLCIPYASAKKADNVSSQVSSGTSISSQVKDEKAVGNMCSVIEQHLDAPEISAEHPFNEVDAMVLCVLTYLPCNMIPAIDGQKSSDSITIEQWSNVFDSIFDKKGEYQSLHDEDNRNLMYYQSLVKNKKSSWHLNNVKLLHTLAKSSRYRNIRVGNFCSKMQGFWKNNPEQFAAVTFSLKDGSKIVSFRGTDGALEGWWEDFNMPWANVVPAQADAEKYLSKITEKYSEDSFTLIGHSKGGQLVVHSVFKYIANNPKLVDKIIKAYNLDGPGLRDDINATFSADTQKIANSKIISVKPESSVIGKMICNCAQGKRIFVKSNTDNILIQHDANTWQIAYDDKHKNFKLCVGMEAPESQLVEEMLSNFIKFSKKEDIATFVKMVFGFVRNNNIDINNVEPFNMFFAILYKYAIQGKSVKEIFSVTASPSKAFVMTKQEKAATERVLNTMTYQFLQSYWKRFDKVNESLGISKSVAKELAKHKGKNLSTYEIAKLSTKIFIYNKFKIYAIQNFFSKSNNSVTKSR